MYGDGRFTVSLLARWLEPKLKSKPKIYVDRIPPTGRIVYLTLQPGIGLEMEDLIDNPTFNVAVRGAPGSYEDAEAIAMDVDSFVLENSGGFTAENVVVKKMGRTGGGPQQVSIADSQNRFSFSCNYYAKVFTNIGKDYS